MLESREVQARLRTIARVALAVGLLVILQGASCKTPAPTSDSTPPVLKWSVVNDVTRETQKFTGDGNVTGSAGDSFTVTLRAEDPQGVHRIALGGSATWSCVQGEIGQTKIAEYETDVQELEPDSEGKVLTKIFLIRDVDLSSFSCPSGFAFGGGSVELVGEGENYFGGTTMGTLTLSRS